MDGKHASGNCMNDSTCNDSNPSQQNQKTDQKDQHQPSHGKKLCPTEILHLGTTPASSFVRKAK